MKTFKPVKAAVIGCGMISDIYLKNCVQAFNILDMVGCSDIVPERAAKRAEQYGIRHMTNEEILADPEIEIVVNLTYPTAHYEVSKAALLAGKHVHTEKMMAITLDQARDLVRISREKGLHITAAPDTFLGARLQTARRILDSGLIGTPISADMTLARGYRHADWKQEDEKRFAFCPGGSILNDVGCYYLTALVSMLGSIEAVTGFYDTYEPARIFRHPKNPSYGKEMVYEAPNNFAGGLRFACGTLCSVMMTSETAGGGSHFAIYGTLGTIQLDDPNEFGGPLLVNLRGGSGPLPIP
ncbi:MAG TPA: Gfo/Idh/MocA family oxidoreductase, partial [Clostridia bacterium]|nr:Gfo/Idh/MocA family oxidoreductase [Clostridia bacterium]